MEKPDVDSNTDSKALNSGSSGGNKVKGDQEGLESVAVSSAAVETREGAITCNSTEMIREKQQCIGGKVMITKLLCSRP